MKAFLAIFCLIAINSQAQWKSYRLTNNNDTINCIDYNDLKQGRWSIKIPGLRGEPGRDEEGVFIDGKKEGIWRTYTSIGDLFAIERYRWGHKDGVSQYFNITGLVRDESWKAVNPANPYDTIDVIDPVNPKKVYRQIIKLEGGSVKHGPWNYYEGGLITKTQHYFLDKLNDPMKGVATTGDPSADLSIEKTKAPVKAKPKEVMEFEKKVGKKKVKVLDGTSF